MGPDATIGYTYQGGTYCPACILPTFHESRDEDWIALPTKPLDVSCRLSDIAYELGIDHCAETTFDSDDFPKIIFADSTTAASDRGAIDEGGIVDYCGRCHEPLID
jgi:hypothetical protein